MHISAVTISNRYEELCSFHLTTFRAKGNCIYIYEGSVRNPYFDMCKKCPTIGHASIKMCSGADPCYFGSQVDTSVRSTILLSILVMF